MTRIAEARSLDPMSAIHPNQAGIRDPHPLFLFPNLPALGIFIPMNPIAHPSRRHFLKQLAATGAACAAWPLAPRLPAAQPTPRFACVAFSKPFQKLGPDETADLVAEVGWDGIECPVRKGGQIEPDRVEEDLPRLVEALARRGKRIEIMTTDITDANDPKTQRVLRAGAKLGIRHYRLAHLRYDPQRPIPEQLSAFRLRMKELETLNRELGVCGGYQNHSGSGYVGGPVWDIHEMIHDCDPRHLGTHFDIGHATVEGGYAWRTHARLMTPFFSAVYVKDFYWKKTGSNWQAEWRPLGEGMISREFFNLLKQSNFAGPISQHHEYPLGDKSAMIQSFKKDLIVLRQWLA